MINIKTGDFMITLTILLIYGTFWLFTLPLRIAIWVMMQCVLLPFRMVKLLFCWRL